MSSVIDRIEARAFFAGESKQVKRLSLTLSDTWAPYVRGTLECPLPAAPAIAALDPRQAEAPTINVSVVRAFGGDQNRLSRWTQAAGPPTVKMSELTAAGAGAASWGTGFADQYNGAPVSGQEMQLTLAVDELETDERAGTMTLTIGGKELRLQDASNPGLARTLLAPRIRDWVNEVLQDVHLHPLGAGDGMMQYLPPVWEDGMSAWDVIAQRLDELEYRLIWDETGRWRVVNRDTTRPGPPVTLAGLKEIRRKLARRDWYDSVSVMWRWEENDPISGQKVQKWRREWADLGTWSRTMYVEKDAQFPGNFLAAELLRRYSRTGETHTYTAPIDLTVRPLDTISITDSAGTRTATITSVTLALPEAELTVETREE